MASFTEKAGYHVEKAPKLDENGNPMKNAAGNVKTVETITGREGDSEQQGVRLLITGARTTSHIRKKDGKKINDVYLKIVKANDRTPKKYAAQLSARAELKNDAIIVHNNGKLDVRYQHEQQFSYVEGETNPKLDLLSEYTIGPNGPATVDDLISGKVDCLAVNAPVRPYTLSNKAWEERREIARKRYPNLEVPETRNHYKSYSIVLERDENGNAYCMSKPGYAPDMIKHNSNTKYAKELSAELANKTIEAQNAVDVELSQDEITNDVFGTDFDDLEI